MQAIPVAGKCPACQTSIQYDHDLLSPRPGLIYRCHVCRLELVIDPVTDKPVLAPMSDQISQSNTGVKRERRRP
jgi:hypothetical protein